MNILMRDDLLITECLISVYKLCMKLSCLHATVGVNPADSSTEVGTPEDLIGWFNSEIQKNAATFVVYYRGLW